MSGQTAVQLGVQILIRFRTPAVLNELVPKPEHQFEPVFDGPFADGLYLHGWVHRLVLQQTKEPGAALQPIRKAQ
jgi:hypothetical protein